MDLDAIPRVMDHTSNMAKAFTTRVIANNINAASINALRCMRPKASLNSVATTLA